MSFYTFFTVEQSQAKLFVSNLAFSVDEQKLQEIFCLAGKVVSVEVQRDSNLESRGQAIVEYANPGIAAKAISMFNDQAVGLGRKMTVRFDKTSGPAASAGGKAPRKQVIPCEIL